MRATRFFGSLLRRIRGRRTELVLVIAALAAYLPAVDWGLPEAWSATRVHVWAFDDISPLPALSEIYQTLFRPGPDRWVAYPPLHHYVLGLAFAPYLGWLALTGQPANPSPLFPYGLADPVTTFQTLALIARLLSILMAADIILAVCWIGEAVWDRRTGLWAAWAVAAAYPMFYYTKTACLEIPYTFWATLATLVYARLLVREPNSKRLAALGVLAALAAATKDQAAGLFLLLPIPLAVRFRQSSRHGRADWRQPAALLVAGGVAYALARGLVFDFGRYLDHVRWILRPDGMLAEEFIAWYPDSIWYPDGLIGTLRHAAAIVQTLLGFLGPPMMAFAAFGLLETARSKPGRLWLAFPAISYIFTFLLVIDYFQRR
jgi:4-amino-4-deoxy-L-arabinose transferase-like glycosyltransferase